MPQILHLWRMKLSLSDEYIFSFSRSSVVSFSTLYTLLSRALPRYPVDYFIGEIQLTNYAFSYDMICHNLGPLLVFFFLYWFLTFPFIPTCKTEMLGWVGLEIGPRKVAEKAS